MYKVTGSGKDPSKYMFLLLSIIKIFIVEINLKVLSMKFWGASGTTGTPIKVGMLVFDRLSE